MRRSRAGDQTNIVQPIPASHQCRCRFKTQITLCEMRVIRRDVGRIADDHIKGFPCQCGKPVTQSQLDIIGAQPARVFSGHIQRRLRVVYGSYAGEGAVFGDGNGNRSAAGTQLQYAARFLLRNMRQCRLDQRFRIRARNQHLRRHDKIQPVKLALAQHIGYGLAGQSPLQQQCKCLGLIR